MNNIDKAKAVEMINGYLAEGNIHKDWVECLQICKKALIQQIPKKMLDKFPISYCPKCDRAVYSDMNYCSHCGQALDWGYQNDV